MIVHGFTSIVMHQRKWNIVSNVIRPFYRNHYYQQYYKVEFAYFVEMAFELISAF